MNVNMQPRTVAQIQTVMMIAYCKIWVMIMEYTNKFDLDLKKGQLGEQLVQQVLCDCKIEVKTDALIQQTKNIAVEFESRGHASGIEVTTADWWAFVIVRDFKYKDIILMVRTSRLKQLVAIYKERHTGVGGDDDTSKMVLIPFDRIIQ